MLESSQCRDSTITDPGIPTSLMLKLHHCQCKNSSIANPGIPALLIQIFPSSIANKALLILELQDHQSWGSSITDSGILASSILVFQHHQFNLPIQGCSISTAGIQHWKCWNPRISNGGILALAIRRKDLNDNAGIWQKNLKIQSTMLEFQS